MLVNEQTSSSCPVHPPRCRRRRLVHDLVNTQLLPNNMHPSPPPGWRGLTCVLIRVEGAPPESTEFDRAALIYHKLRHYRQAVIRKLCVARASRLRRPGAERRATCAFPLSHLLVGCLPASCLAACPRIKLAGGRERIVGAKMASCFVT